MEGKRSSELAGSGYYEYETVEDGLVQRSTKPAIMLAAEKAAKAHGKKIWVYSPSGQYFWVVGK